MSELRDWKGAAERLGVKSSWLRNQTKQGTGPTYLQPSPKTILFRDEDLDRWRASWKVVGAK
jgi:hypothetical protein